MRALPVVRAVLGAAVLLWAAAPVAVAQSDPQADHAHAMAGAGGDRMPRTFAYTPATIAAFERLPIQESGRVKPFLTYSRFLLLRLAERTSVAVPDEPRFGDLAGASLEPVSWALDVMLYPAQADEYPTFLIPDRDLLDRVGLGEAAKRKRDRYSFNDLRPGIERIAQEARPLLDKEEKVRDRLQNQLVYLYRDLSDYMSLRTAFTAARAPFRVGDSEVLRSVFGDVSSVRFADGARNYGQLSTQFMRLRSDQEREAELQAVGDFLRQQREVADLSSYVIWLPPSDQRTEAWLDLDGVFGEIGRDGPAAHGTQLQAIELQQNVADAAARASTTSDPTALEAAATTFVDHVRRMTSLRGEGSHVDMEVTYYRVKWLYWALILLVIGCVTAAVSWAFVKSRWPMWLTWSAVGSGTVMLVVGIVYRCIIRQRPPISTLYETFLAVAAGIAIVGMVVEVLIRRRIALSAAAYLGATTLWLADRYEFMRGEDTMPQLQAVLDTNFYLSIHVTTVTLGYMASLLAGGVGAVYLIGRLFSDDVGFFQAVGRIVYGVLCFGLLLSLFGTIMGGIWANDSWGRFWGWDPKENGALMIVLWQLLILHGRMGGYWRNWGMSMLAVIGNMIVAFSWFHVNLMGVGLHSYGFDAGLKSAVVTFYWTQGAILGLGFVAWLLMRTRAETARLRADATPATSSGGA
ncbi:MAG: cytochrome c biogenesis protein CcsA [Planctomycetes bacterium]|nr:cytochrome c biogenesis protein CcsA [Planctomycetota bacterium]